jgi:hypothetical protein
MEATLHRRLKIDVDVAFVVVVGLWKNEKVQPANWSQPEKSVATLGMCGEFTPGMLEFN